MNNQVDITTLSIVELKALLFDLSSDMNRIKQGMELVSNQLVEKGKMQVPSEVIAEVKEDVPEVPHSTDSAESSEEVDKSE